MVFLDNRGADIAHALRVSADAVNKNDISFFIIGMPLRCNGRGR